VQVRCQGLESYCVFFLDRKNDGSLNHGLFSRAGGSFSLEQADQEMDRVIKIENARAAVS